MITIQLIIYSIPLTFIEFHSIGRFNLHRRIIEIQKVINVLIVDDEPDITPGPPSFTETTTIFLLPSFFSSEEIMMLPSSLVNLIALLRRLETTCDILPLSPSMLRHS